MIGTFIPKWSASADNAGYALAFDGAGDRVALNSTTALFGGTTGWTSTKTISLWVRPDASTVPNTTPATGQVLIGNDKPHTFGITRAVFNGADRIWIWNADANGVETVGVDYQVGEWMQLALVHDNGTLRAYKNGVLVGQVASGPTYLPSSSAAGNVWIGGNSKGTSSSGFAGEIDEVRIWKVALSQSEIQNWMNQEIGASHPEIGELAAYYKMSNGSGTQLADDSGQGHDGSLMGGMGDQSWVASGAFLSTTTATPSPTPVPATATPTLTAAPATPTVVAPSATPTSTLLPPSPTPTYTSEPLTSTPTATFIPSTATASPIPATSSPTPTNTPMPATSTSTPTAEPPTPTATVPSFTPTASNTPSSTGAGYALDFDGNDDFVELPTTLSILGDGWQDNMTISLWVRPDVEAGICDHNLPAWCDNILGDRPRWWGVSIGEVAGLNRIWVWNYDGSSSSPIDMIPIDYTPGEWVHVTMVHSNGVLRAYRNGIEVGSIPSGTTQQPSTGALPHTYLGGIINNSSRIWTFDGQIDEVRMWSTARSPEDIQADLYHTIDPSSPNLAAYYQMSDGSGNLLTDDTGHGNAGQLYDGANGVGPDGTPPEWVDSTAPLSGVAPSPMPTATATATATVGLSATLGAPSTPSPTPTITILPPSSTPTPTATAAPPTDIPTITPTPSATAGPTSTPSPTATNTALPLSSTPTPTATSAPPTDAPTITPTPSATLLPSATPTPGAGLSEISSISTSGDAYDLALEGNFAYVAATSGGLRIIDVSDPWYPVEVGSFHTATKAYGVAVANGIAYVAATSSGVYIIDVSDPTAPTLISNPAVGSFPWDLELRGGYLYVSDRLEGLHIMDVSDPASPHEVGFVPTQDQTLDVAFDGSTMFVADDLAGVQIVDISDPANPQVMGNLATAQAYGVSVLNGRLYVSDGGHGLRVFDLSDPSAPQETGGYATGGSIRTTWPTGPAAYLANWSYGLYAVDTSIPGTVTLIDHLTTPGRARDVSLRNGVVYLADYGGGLRIYTGP